MRAYDSLKRRLKFGDHPAETTKGSSRMRIVHLVVIVLLAGWVAPAAGQSLASVARKEEARRKQLKQSSKVITNKDLRQVDPASAPVSPPPAATPAPTPAPAPETAAPGPPGAKPPDEAAQREEDEKAWRQKMADARLALERNQMYAEALQSRINALWADFTARDDPAQRAQIELDRKRALAEQERVKGEIEAQKKAIGDLEEEARKAGVPPGWIR
jgi:hypothetical protein